MSSCGGGLGCGLHRVVDPFTSCDTRRQDCPHGANRHPLRQRQRPTRDRDPDGDTDGDTDRDTDGDTDGDTAGDSHGECDRDGDSSAYSVSEGLF